MMVQVTLNLPDGLVNQAQELAGLQARDVSAVLADALQKLWPWVEVMPEALPEGVLRGLSDAEVMAMAALKLDGGQNARLGELQARGKVIDLTEFERFELWMLLQVYGLGQLRKSEGLAEVVRRGLRAPLAS
jgi:predicted transcriptional regulator